jgi:2-oxoglutarate ferredoxin oxidoreductase subunit delta
MPKTKSKPGITIIEDLCKGCGLCVVSCPKNCIEMGKHVNVKGVNPAVFSHSESCTGCRNCAVICPDIAIEAWKIEEDEGPG